MHSLLWCHNNFGQKYFICKIVVLTFLADHSVSTIYQAEAKDPASGSSYFYNAKTGQSQWEHPGETASSKEIATSTLLPVDWEEAVDDSTGMQHVFKAILFCQILKNKQYNS